MCTLMPVDLKSNIYDSSNFNYRSSRPATNKYVPTFKASNVVVAKQSSLPVFAKLRTMFNDILNPAKKSEDLRKAMSIDQIQTENLHEKYRKQGRRYYRAFNDHMIFRIVQLIQTDKAKGILLSNFFIKACNEPSLVKQVSNEDVDYLADKFTANPGVGEYLQYGGFETLVKLLKIQDDDSDFFEEYMAKKLHKDITPFYKNINIEGIDEIHQLKKEKPETYNLLINSPLEYDADEMLLLKDNYTEKTEESIKTVKEQLKRVYSDYFYNYTSKPEVMKERKLNLINLGLLNEKHPKVVDYMARLNTYNYDAITAMIEREEDRDFQEYMQYVGKDIERARAYSVNAKKYKDILDNVVEKPRSSKYIRYHESYEICFRDKVNIINEYLQHIGDRLDYIPTTIDELEVAKKLCEKYTDPKIKITKEMVELAQLSNSNMFNLTQL